MIPPFLLSGVPGQTQGGTVGDKQNGTWQAHCVHSAGLSDSAVLKEQGGPLGPGAALAPSQGLYFPFLKPLN